jgi:glycolate oxidase FAD binding subunit
LPEHPTTAQTRTASPETAEALAFTLARAASLRKIIEVGGNFTKRAGAGPIARPDLTVSTANLNRVLAYEPRDLTISVEAGITYAELSRVLAPNRQMIPLDPPFPERATIGGIVASNSSGPRRRLFGTSRDLVIGMKFATLEGKLIQSGGMVVKNVAGLDMAKLMIGSWGTLAAITSVNFKLAPVPDLQRTMLLGVDSSSAAFEIRDKIIRSSLQPWAIDFISLGAATELGFRKALLALEFGGNKAVIERCTSEIGQWGEAVELTGEEAGRFWNRIQNFTPKFLEKFTGGVMLRVSTTLSDMCEAIDSLAGPVIARAASGVIYAHFSLPYSAAKWMAANPRWTSVIEYAPAAQKDELPLWPSAGKEIELMKRVKEMFDPHNLLNRGRYYRHF